MGAPSIIYFISDEHAAHAMGHAGDTNLRTPGFDGMARAGASFARAYANSPICTCSRATMFTGRHAHGSGVPGFFGALHPLMPTSASLLGKAGYRTVFFGKWHLGPPVRDDKTILHPDGAPLRGTRTNVPRRFRGGFEDWRAFNCCHDHFRSYYFHDDEDEPRIMPGYQTDWLTDLAIAHLEDYDREEPLFLVVSVAAPHFPLQAPPEFLRFDPSALKTRPNFEDTPGMRGNLATYYAMVENVDRNLGRLRGAIRNSSRFGDAILAYFSDHGEYGGAHGRFNRKELPHEEGVRIPMIWEWPGRIAAGGRPQALFGLVDLLPTTLGLAGLPSPGFAQGRDFSPLLRGEAFGGPEAQLLEMVESPRWSDDHLNWRGIVTEDWKYALFEDGRELLFDLRSDPHELNNLGELAPAERGTMRRRLREMLRDTGEPFFDLFLED